MLILSRLVGEKIIIGDNIVINIASVTDHNHVRIGITAPKNIPIYREEVYLRIKGKEQEEK